MSTTEIENLFNSLKAEPYKQLDNNTKTQALLVLETCSKNNLITSNIILLSGYLLVNLLQNDFENIKDQTIVWNIFIRHTVSIYDLICPKKKISFENELLFLLTALKPYLNAYENPYHQTCFIKFLDKISIDLNKYKHLQPFINFVIKYPLFDTFTIKNQAYITLFISALITDDTNTDNIQIFFNKICNLLKNTIFLEYIIMFTKTHNIRPTEKMCALFTQYIKLNILSTEQLFSLYDSRLAISHHQHIYSQLSHIKKRFNLKYPLSEKDMPLLLNMLWNGDDENKYMQAIRNIACHNLDYYQDNSDEIHELDFLFKKIEDFYTIYKKNIHTSKLETYRIDSIANYLINHVAAKTPWFNFPPTIVRFFIKDCKQIIHLSCILNGKYQIFCANHGTIAEIDEIDIPKYLANLVNIHEQATHRLEISIINYENTINKSMIFSKQETAIPSENLLKDTSPKNLPGLDFRLE